MAYQTTKPAPNDDLDVSVTDIQQNFLTANTVMDVDHFPFNNLTANKGYHKVIHQPEQGTWNEVARTIAPPIANIAGVDQVVSLNYTPDFTGGIQDTQLFNITGLGGISQLTGSSSETDGWQWIGGVLLQWGQVINPGTSGTVTFKNRGPISAGIPFPKAVFSIIVSLQRTNASETVTIDNAIPPTNQQFKYLTSSGGSNKLYWFAIGW